MHCGLGLGSVLHTEIGAHKYKFTVLIIWQDKGKQFCVGAAAAQSSLCDPLQAVV